MVTATTDPMETVFNIAELGLGVVVLVCVLLVTTIGPSVVVVVVVVVGADVGPYPMLCKSCWKKE
jgi:xanthine/uracil permease